MFFPSLRRISVGCAASGVLLLGAAIVAAAQDTQAAGDNHSASQQTVSERTHERLEQALHSINRGHSIGQVAVSPDGKRLAWVDGMRRGGEIRVAPLHDLAKSERITTAATAEQHCNEGQLTWAPDSSALAFFSDCASDGDQSDLYVWRSDGNGARRLTELHGYVNQPSFSRDGQTIAFLYVKGATRAAGALAAMKSPSGVIGEDGVEIQRVAVTRLDGASPNATEVSPANLHVYEFDWAPDSKSLVYTAADPPGENNWWVAKLYTQELTGAPKAILDPQTVAGTLHGMQIAVPRWSPDEKNIAFIGGLMSDQGVTGGDVWVVPSAGGEPQNLTPQWGVSPEWIEWGANDQIFASQLAGGDCELAVLSLINPKGNFTAPPAFIIPGTIGDGRLALSLSFTADHSLAVFEGSSFDRPAEIYASNPRDFSDPKGGFAKLKQLSHFNDSVKPSWGKTISVDWDNDGFHVQGWLMFPRDYDPAKKYPLLVEVHGGPAAAVTARWAGGAGGFGTVEFSALGYFVLMPNPRGSYGQGEAFTQANRKDFGYGDLRDILAGVDRVLATYPVDPGRVGLAGWSYGGFMSMFAVTQTNRFKAAVAGAGISDWLSYYGENSIDQWMIPYFGASVYDDPQVYAKSSAITYIKQAKTPTLAVVGDRDGECPAPQSFEFWHALRDQHVPSQLVVYANEGHGFVDPAHRRDVMERAVDWFERYMPPKP